MKPGGGREHSAGSWIITGSAAEGTLMQLDDGFDADNPYHSVAMIYAGFLCERCGAYCSGTPDGTGEERQVPYRLMAETAQRRGWLVEDRDSACYDYLVLCPGCTNRPDR
jgi:hypothetical protein